MGDLNGWCGIIAPTCIFPTNLHERNRRFQALSGPGLAHADVTAYTSGDAYLERSLHD